MNLPTTFSTLPEIKAECISERDQLQVHARRTAESAWRLGRWLLAARDKIPHGDWLDWLRLEIGISRTTAWRCIRIATDYDIDAIRGQAVKELLSDRPNVSSETFDDGPDPEPDALEPPPETPARQRVEPPRQSAFSFEGTEPARTPAKSKKAAPIPDDADPFAKPKPVPKRTRTEVLTPEVGGGPKPLKPKERKRPPLTERLSAQIRELERKNAELAREKGYAMSRLAALDNEMAANDAIIQLQTVNADQAGGLLAARTEIEGLWRALRDCNAGISHQTLAERYGIEEWSGTMNSRLLYKHIEGRS